MSSGENIVPSISDVAVHFKVNRRTVSEWIGAGAPGKIEGSGYDIDAISKWHTLNRQPKKDETDTDLQRRLLIADVEKKEAEAAIKTHEKVKKTEAVVHLDDVEQFLSLLFTRGRRRLMRVAEELPPGYPKEIRDILREDLEERLRIWLKSMASDSQNLTELREP